MAARIQWLRRLGVTCVALTFVLMVVGAWVKATGSGLACPDWPTCYGEWLPPFPSLESPPPENRYDVDGDGDLDTIGYTQAQVLYEWAHRALVSLIGIPVVAFAVVAWRARELRPSLRAIPALAVAVLAVQAALGMVTVLTGNPPWATTLHLAVAVVWFAMLLTATCIAFLAPVAPAPAIAAREASPHPAFAPAPTPIRFVAPGAPGDGTGGEIRWPGEEPHGR